MLTPTTGVYGKIGYHHSKAVVTGGSIPESDKFQGIGYGLGIKSFIRKDIYIQAEGLVTDYKRKNYGGNSVGFETATATISLGYRF